MSQPNRPPGMISNLQELKRRLDAAEDVVVDQTGKIHRPDDPEVKHKKTQDKTTVKPSRWF